MFYIITSKLKKQKVLTEIADITEPLTLSEVKEHLRLNNFLDEDVENEKLLNAGEYAIGNYTSNGIDVLNKTTIINVNAGVFNGNSIVKIQESDNNINYYDWYTFDTIDSSNDEQIHTKEYAGTRQYIRVYVTVAVNVCDFSIEGTLYNFDIEDNILLNFISSAREFGEDYTLKKFASVSIQKQLDKFPSNDIITWEYEPLTSITEFKYKDVDGNETSLTETTDYIVDTTENIIYTPPYIYFPTTQLWNRNAITIVGTCGYTRDNIPRCYKIAMLLHVGLMYQNRDKEIPIEALNTVYRFYNMTRSGWF